MSLKFRGILKIMVMVMVLTMETAPQNLNPLTISPIIPRMMIMPLLLVKFSRVCESHSFDKLKHPQLK